MKWCVLDLDSSVTDSPRNDSRLWSLLRYLKFGIQFNREKLEALLRGDQSGAVVDSFFLYGSHALGMPYCIRMEDTFCYGPVTRDAEPTMLGAPC
jgi:hypothetical protein